MKPSDHESDSLPASNAGAAALDQRLRQLRGHGQAPDAVWQQIAQRIAQPAATDLPSAQPSRTLHHWWASAALVLIALTLTYNVNHHSQPQSTNNPSVTNTTAVDSAGNWDDTSIAVINAETMALDDYYQQMVYPSWPLSSTPDTALTLAYLEPELEALLQARQQVRMALTQAPESTFLLTQLATLDRWQYQLLRQVNTASGMSV